jgi:group I intron endonuclease
MQGFIYKIKIAHKFYYGQTINPDQRKSHHLRKLKAGKHCNPYMQRCFDKHDDFSFEVIATVTDAAHLDEVEQHYLDAHIDEVDCMNIARIASKPPSPKGKKLSAEHKAKLSAAINGKKRPDKQQVCYGRPVGATDWIKFSSRSEAAAHVGGDASNVGKCAAGKAKTAYGWEFKETP